MFDNDIVCLIGEVPLMYIIYNIMYKNKYLTILGDFIHCIHTIAIKVCVKPFGLFRFLTKLVTKSFLIFIQVTTIDNRHSVPKLMLHKKYMLLLSPALCLRCLPANLETYLCEEIGGVVKAAL